MRHVRKEPRPNDIDTNRNVVRNNAALGVDVEHGFFGLDLTNDYVCGNGTGGIVVRGNLVSADVIGTGLATAYNAAEVTIPVPPGHGIVFLDSFEANTVDFSNDSAFTANLACGLRNDTSTTVLALNNQWRGDVDPDVPPANCEDSPDFCPGNPITCSVQDHQNVAVVLDEEEPAFPSNAILKGQTVRVQGKGFNAIAGNPLSTDANCALGAADVSANNCCRKKTKANECGPGSPPTPPGDGSNCVALRSATGQWQPLAVTSVTPTTIVAEVPSGGYACVGGMGEMVRVNKKDSSGDERSDVEIHCLNAAPF